MATKELVEKNKNYKEIGIKYTRLIPMKKKKTEQNKALYLINEQKKIGQKKKAMKVLNRIIKKLIYRMILMTWLNILKKMIKMKTLAKRRKRIKRRKRKKMK